MDLLYDGEMHSIWFLDFTSKVLFCLVLLLVRRPYGDLYLPNKLAAQKNSLERKGTVHHSIPVFSPEIL